MDLSVLFIVDKHATSLDVTVNDPSFVEVGNTSGSFCLVRKSVSRHPGNQGTHKSYTINHRIPTNKSGQSAIPHVRRYEVEGFLRVEVPDQ